MAWILTRDPHSTLAVEDLHGGWPEEYTNIIKKFYSDHVDQVVALSELNQLILRIGNLGQVIARKQKLITPPKQVLDKLASVVVRPALEEKEDDISL